VKDIQEIMTEMEKMTKQQVAVELNDEEKEELKKLLNTNDHQNLNWPKPTVKPVPCINLGTCSDEVPYCCKVSVPRDFNPTSPFTPKLSAVSGLYCYVDPCPCEVSCVADLGVCLQETLTLTVYPVRIIGCIQYITSASSLQGEAGIVGGTGTTFRQLNPNTNSADISGQGSLRVNQIVKFQKYAPTSDQRTPKLIPTNALQCTLNAALEDCMCENNPAETNFDTKVVAFRGIFKLPTNCGDPTPCPTSAPGL
jgi:hypothetical protein